VTYRLQVRRLTTADATLYREIRLEGLRCSPEAFGSTFEMENAQPLSWFSERLQSGAKMFGAFEGLELVGVAGLLIKQGKKEAHKGLLVGMYVRPGYRRSGVGQRLVEAMVEFAAGRVELIQLVVLRDNDSALRLYTRLGFQQYGIERNALKQEGRYYDEILMARDLGQGKA
jgi:ribosomal protein S18 acetylase RimI-like enzyme